MRSVEQSEEFLSDELFQVCQLGDSAATAGDGGVAESDVVLWWSLAFLTIGRSEGYGGRGLR
jgi:hypothetical protein